MRALRAGFTPLSYLENTSNPSNAAEEWSIPHSQHSLCAVVRDHIEAVVRVEEEVVVEACFCGPTENCRVVSADRKVVVEAVVVVPLGDAHLRESDVTLSNKQTNKE